MDHPTPDELLEFLDDDLAGNRRARVADHVDACDECQRRVASWEGARSGLDAWELPESLPVLRARQFRAASVHLRRAVAAALLVAGAFGAARLTAPRPDVVALREELAGQIRGELRREFHEELAKIAADQSAGQDLFAALVERIDQLELQWLADYVDLRRDVETVAMHTQADLQRLAGDRARQGAR